MNTQRTLTVLAKSRLANATQHHLGATTVPIRSFSGRHTGKEVKFPRPLRTKKRGIDIIHDPLWNKSLAFDFSERDRLGLRGLLPPTIRSLESQVAHNIKLLRALPDDVSKNLYLQDLHNRNETLYHRIVIDYIEEIAPLVYTPTVGTVCQQYGVRFNRTRGMFFSAQDKGKFSTMVYNWPHDDVHVIVVTDGSRILGLGDLGAHGMGIPIGKLALYCAAGGIAPHRVLPVMLDVGTNNEQLLKDPQYVGLRQPRLTGDEYFELVDEFMSAVFGRWPNVVVQFEDFETSKAIPLLNKYRKKYRCFNDDIQGTGCVTLAGVLSAARISGMKLTDMRFVCAGAGSAGLGVCSQLVDGMVGLGLTREEAMKRFVLCTVDGAIGKKDGKLGNPHQDATAEQKSWANPAVSDGTSLLNTVKSFKPHVLLGLSTQANIFTEEMIKDMATHVERPIILPMTNPTHKSECTPTQAYTWTNGRAIVATGSPFGPVKLPDGREFFPSQCNNMFVYPGIGLATSVAGITQITDKMLYVAATACASSTTAEDIEVGRTFPPVNRIRDVAQKVACAVIEEGIQAGLTTKITSKHIEEGIPNLISRKMYFPTYVPLL